MTTSTCQFLSPAGGQGKVKGGRHIKYAKPTPMANLHLTLLDSVGVHLARFFRR